MILSADEAMNAIADAVWWMKGFAAAHGDEQSRNTVRSMEARLQESREFLSCLVTGERNFIAPHRIVVTPALVENLSDVLRAPEHFTYDDAQQLGGEASKAIALHDRLRDWSKTPQDLPF